MTRSRSVWFRGALPPSVAAIALLLLSAGRAYGQAGDFTKRVPGQLFGVEIPINLRAEQATVWKPTVPDDRARLVSNGKQLPALQASSGSHHRSIGRKVAGGVIGAVGGFYAGGFLGATIERPCHCDDPGLKGFIIGAPIGAVIVGILGAKFF